MRKDLITLKPIYSSFLSCDKDINILLKTLFVSSKPHSDILKRLLIINNSDCLNKQKYQSVIDSFSLKDLRDKGYIRTKPKISRGTHQQIKTYLIISFGPFSPNRKNPAYRDYIINFDIVCYNDAWELDDYKIRPLMICGYIDGILSSLTKTNQQYMKTNQSQIKLTGIGQYEFLNCNQVVLNEDLSMYSLSYQGVHFTEDIKQIGQIANE